MLSLVAADSSHQESYLYQLFVEKEESVMVPTTQQLLQLSFYQSQIKLREVSHSLSQSACQPASQSVNQCSVSTVCCR